LTCIKDCRQLPKLNQLVTGQQVAINTHWPVSTEQHLSMTWCIQLQAISSRSGSFWLLGRQNDKQTMYFLFCSWKAFLTFKYRVFHINWGWVSSLKKYFNYILDSYEYHIYWYVFRVQGYQLFIDPNWCQIPSMCFISTYVDNFTIGLTFLRGGQC
jgi:hypothetical protein